MTVVNYTMDSVDGEVNDHGICIFQFSTGLPQDTILREQPLYVRYLMAEEARAALNLISQNVKVKLFSCDLNYEKLSDVY